MRDQQQVERMAEEFYRKWDEARIKSGLDAAAFYEQQRQALQGPPERLAPGIDRITDWGLRELRQRAFKALRTGERLYTVRLPLP